MGSLSRREFIKSSMVAGASMALAAPFSKVRGANDDIRLAVVGLGWKGSCNRFGHYEEPEISGHCKDFNELDGVRVVAVCDADQVHIDRTVEAFKKHNLAVDCYRDVRRLLEDKSIDAVSIATPNHWHALIAIWACQAGKDVYVEKPVSHSIWEGRKIVEAARKYNRIVQAGTQQRSCPAVQEAARDIQAGRFGKALWVHCSKLKTDKRGPIGKVTTPQPVPDNIDYNLWAGPAPKTPVMRKSFHYDWHWQWNWGDGDMANWGIHYLDDMRHLLGWDDVPASVVTAGNRFAWDDNGQTPNMSVSLMYHDGLPIVVDIRNLPDPKHPGGKEGAIYLYAREGNYIQFENASIRISRGGGGAYDKDNKRIHQYKGDGGKAHAGNFIKAVRSRKVSDLNADILKGHLSTAMGHLANISWRVGSEATVDQVRESMNSHEDALNTLSTIVEQLGDNDVDLAKEPFILGPVLTFDRKQERFVGENAEQANKFIELPYREPFVVPDEV
jgi:predicted dehydrogenase